MPAHSSYGFLMPLPLAWGKEGGLASMDFLTQALAWGKEGMVTFSFFSQGEGQFALIIHEMKRRKFPLPGRERVGERVTVKRAPLHSVPSRRGRGNILAHYL